jgi:predicted alpha/beta superfamily hydrolase
MRTLIQQHCILIGFLLIFQNAAISQIERNNETNPKVTLDRTEMRILHSKIVDQDYEIFISLPNGYNQSNSSYPVIIGLDAYTGFLIMKGCVDAFTSLYPLMPEVILTGIGYGGDETNSLAKWIAGRTRDFTPLQNTGTEEFYEKFITDKGLAASDVQTGGAHLFLEFINNELFPFLNSNYRIDQENKVLVGASLGGLFAFYTVFHKPDTFDKYLIESPSLHYSNGVTFQYENDYAKNHSDLDMDIFMCAGELEGEHSVNVKKMEELLLSRDYPQLNLETVIFENESHISCAPAAISRGLIELFNNE